VQCGRRTVTRITTITPARSFSVNGLQNLEFLTASHGRGSDYEVRGANQSRDRQTSELIRQEETLASFEKSPQLSH
jgi:hypothetical protein